MNFFPLLVCIFSSNMPYDYTEIGNNGTAITKVGVTIQGDFDGDGKLDALAAIKLKESVGNPVEDGVAAEYGITLNGKLITDIPIGCCDMKLINEGDLNQDGIDDFSVFQAPMNGCSFTLTSYSFKANKWSEIIPLMLIPTFCDVKTDVELQNMVTSKKGQIFISSPDLSNHKTKNKILKIKLVD